jgi:hypothetical protein
MRIYVYLHLSNDTDCIIKLAKTKFAKILDRKNFKILQRLHGLIATCRDIQIAIIKMCAYNNRSALKLALGKKTINYHTAHILKLILKL